MINNTKIQYISVADKIYKVTDIDFCKLMIGAIETDLTMNDVPESEIWDVEEFRDYKVKLVNNGRQAEIVDFDEWKDRNRKK